jgi:hypothetical protein
MTPQHTIEQKRKAFLQKIVDKGFTILSPYDGSQSKVQKILVRNEACGHENWTDPRNLVTKNTKCGVCNKQTKIDRLNTSSKLRSVEFRKTADLWDDYRHRVYMATRATYRKYKHLINPFDLPRGKAGTRGAYQLDHIKSVRWCFENYIPVKDCADCSNLQMLPWLDNLKKHHR